MIHTAYLAFGSNLGNREENIQRASDLLKAEGLEPVAFSPLIATEPQGFESDNAFLNSAAIFHTTLAPLDLLALTQRIERQLGRTRKSENGTHFDRTIDIDILFYDRLVTSSPELTIPHPHIQERGFVLRPLAAIAPDFVHPVLGLTMQALLKRLPQ